MTTPKQRKALRILWETGAEGLTANQFAARYFIDSNQEYLFTAVSNQGNGACAGKKAWLCAGSLLGRLRKAGLVKAVQYSNPVHYTVNAVPGRCCICGCTWNDPCHSPGHGCCAWVDETETVCTHCAEKEIFDCPETRHCVNSHHQ